MTLKQEITKLYSFIQKLNESKKCEDKAISILKEYDLLYYNGNSVLTNLIYDDFKNRIKALFPYHEYFNKKEE